MLNFYDFINKVKNTFYKDDKKPKEVIFDYGIKELYELATKISNNLGHRIIKDMSGGDYGRAYQLEDNKVLKLTMNKAEYEIANYLKDKNTIYLINYYDVRKIKDEPLYCLIMDLAENLNDYERTFIRDYLNFIFYLNDGDKKSKFRFYQTTEEDMKKFKEDFDSIHPELLNEEQKKKIIQDLINIQKEGEKYNIVCGDLRTANLGWINDRFGRHLVHYDIGCDREREYKRNKKELKSL